MNSVLRLIARLSLLTSVLIWSISAAAGADGAEAGSGLQTTARSMKAMLERGAAAEAVQTGKEAIRSGIGSDPESDYTAVIILAAQGYLRLGMPRSASNLLKDRIATISPDRHTEHASLQNLLARAAIQSGHLEDAEEALNRAAAISAGTAHEQYWAQLLKAHIRFRQKKNTEAEKLCIEAETTARTIGEPDLLAFTKLLRAQIARQAGDTARTTAAYREALAAYRNLATTTDTIQGIISAASGLARPVSAPSTDRDTNSAAAEAAFMRAVELSQGLQDNRSLSQSYGAWGELLESEERFDEALEKTLLALHQSQKSRLNDLLYLQQHQAGRILNKQKHPDRALEMYRAATQSLNQFKKGLSPDCSIADGSFQETTRPIYLDLAGLLIDTAALAGHKTKEQLLLTEARATVETLRTEELRDYFEDACLGAEKSERTTMSVPPPGTALIYTIMFPNRLELLVSLPDGIKRFRSPESSPVVSREVRLLRLTIENRFPAWITSAKKIYDWLLRPLEADLKRLEITTIVFVPDGSLRNIPLTVLHDGTRSIIETYAVATIQGLGFVRAPDTNSSRPAGMLLAGLSESVQGYAPLTNVLDEVRGIRLSYPGASLINSDFQVKKVKEQLDLMPYPLIHIASHGEFTGNSRNNYILTWDGRMTLDHLDRFIRSSAVRKTPVELLSLSACRTAAGDDRASLGLAGLAVKSGARTAVASLWDIDDKSTSELFVAFYRIIRDGGVNRAEALRQAQLEIRKRYDHPYFWSPFLLIGNWL